MGRLVGVGADVGGADVGVAVGIFVAPAPLVDEPPVEVFVERCVEVFDEA